MIRVNIEICNGTPNQVILIEISILTLIDIVVVKLAVKRVKISFKDPAVCPLKYS